MLTTKYPESEFGWYGILGQTHWQQAKYFFSTQRTEENEENSQSKIKHRFPQGWDYVKI